VYILNRDTSNKLTISSPLEAHKSHTLCYHIVGCDVGFESPIFASIELDYADADEDSTGAAARDAEKVIVVVSVMCF
jgi:splicing factor 3B subunit 3